jgi:predicted glycosyltransferase
MIWFDLDNSPHVPIFRPILRELDDRSVPYIVTARDHAQTLDLLKLWNIPHTVIGEHAGKSRVLKVLNLIKRAMQLKGAIAGKSVTLAVSHGSRTQVLAAKYLRVPSVVMLDYEYTETRIFGTAGHLLFPAIIPDERLQKAGISLKRVIRYNGFKEELYLKDFLPDPAFRRNLGIDDAEVMVTVRPPSMTGNYHDPRSEQLYLTCLDHFSSHDRVRVIIVNRTAVERAVVPASIQAKPNVTFLASAVDGLQLLWHSDLVISGGGTMNREGALLGVPTYSIFTGRRPYLDEHLAGVGKLTFLESPAEVKAVPPVRRNVPDRYIAPTPGLTSEVTSLLLEFAHPISYVLLKKP